MLTCSVALATYNGERYILEQLNSIINQTTPPDEIIISDDGSNDKTVQLIESFIQKHTKSKTKISIEKNKGDNKGVAGNFENAIQHTSCDLVFLSDQDDIWEKDKIETIVEAFDNYPEAELFVHDARILLEKDNGFELQNQYFYHLQSQSIGNFIGTNTIKQLDSNIFFNLILSNNPINGMCMVLRREFAKRIIPFPRLTFHDPWISFCAISDDSFFAINKSLAQYRIHSNNTCGIISVNVKKRTNVGLRKVIKSTKDSVAERYYWVKRVYEYLGFSTKDFSNENKKYYHYMLVERLDILKKPSFVSLYLLIKSYRENKYLGEGKNLLFHDIVYILAVSRRKRMIFINSLLK